VSLFAQKYASQTDSLFFEVYLDSLVLNQQVDRALAELEQLRIASLSDSNWEKALHSINNYFRIAEVHREEINYEQIIKNKELLAKFSEPHYAKAAYLQIIGEYYLTKINDYDSSRHYLTLAHQDWAYLGNWEDFAYATLIKGVNYYYVGDYEKSEYWGYVALDSARFHLEPGSLPERTILNMLVALYSTTGEIRKFLTYSEQTKQAYESMDKLALVDSQYLVNLYLNMSSQFIEMQDYEQALSYIEQIRYLDRHMSSLSQGDRLFVDINEGVAFWELGYKDKANKIFIEILSGVEGKASFDKQRLSFHVYSYLSEYAVEKGGYDQALVYLNQALALESVERRYNMNIMRKIGNVYAKMGKAEEAKFWFNKSLVTAEQTYGEKSEMAARVYINFAELYEKEAQFSQALDKYQHGIITNCKTFSSLEYGDNPAISDMIERRLMISLLKGKAILLEKLYVDSKKLSYLELAVQNYQLAAEVIDSLRFWVQADQSKLRYAAQVQEVYESAIRLSLLLYEQNNQEDLLHQAFGYAEKSKAIALREDVQDSDAKQFAGIPDSLLAQEQKLKMDIAYYQKKIFDEEHRKEPKEEQISKWRNKLFQVQETFQALIKYIENNFPTYYELKYEEQLSSVEELMQSLQPNEGIIEYVWGKLNLTVFLLTKDELRYSTQKLDSTLIP